MYFEKSYSTVSDLHRDYIVLVKKYHPDVNESPGAEDVIKEVTAEFMALKHKITVSKGHRTYDEIMAEVQAPLIELQNDLMDMITPLFKEPPYNYIYEDKIVIHLNTGAGIALLSSVYDILAEHGKGTVRVFADHPLSVAASQREFIKKDGWIYIKKGIPPKRPGAAVQFTVTDRFIVIEHKNNIFTYLNCISTGPKFICINTDDEIPLTPAVYKNTKHRKLMWLKAVEIISGKGYGTGLPNPPDVDAAIRNITADDNTVLFDFLQKTRERLLSAEPKFTRRT